MLQAINALTNIAPSLSGSIIIVSGDSLDVATHGTLNLDKNKSVAKVLYVPGLTKNLMFVGHITSIGPTGHIVSFDLQGFWAYPKGNPSQVMLHGTHDGPNDLYKLRCKAPTPSLPIYRCPLRPHLPAFLKLSRCYGGHQHIGCVTFQLVAQALITSQLPRCQLVSGLPALIHHKAACDSCIVAKQHCAIIPK